MMARFGLGMTKNVLFLFPTKEAISPDLSSPPARLLFCAMILPDLAAILPPVRNERRRKRDRENAKTASAPRSAGFSPAGSLVHPPRHAGIGRLTSENRWRKSRPARRCGWLGAG